MFPICSNTLLFASSLKFAVSTKFFPLPSLHEAAARLLQERYTDLGFRPVVHICGRADVEAELRYGQSQVSPGTGDFLGIQGCMRT